MEVFALEHLTFTYPMREQPALDGIDLRIGQGEFVVLCGPSGCGKTTLLRRLKPALAPHGAADGRIFFEGRPLEDLSHRDASAKIGFVMQSPENQIVTDKVWHELAFGLESLGCDTATIRLRVAEMASFFGIQTWFHRKVSELSGGQKQLLALASVMAMQPSALILDEPTSQLDPIAASEFLQTVGRINRELGVTVLLTEHRLEEALPLASRAVVMDRGRLVADGKPEAVGAALRASGHGMFRAMPVPMRVWSAVDNDLPCPMNVRDGRAWLDAVTAGAAIVDVSPVGAASDPGDRPAIAFEDVWFRYEKDLPDAVRGLSYRAYAGRISAILGGNGTGKTTALSLVAGLNAPYRGKVYVDGKDTGKVSRSVLFDRLLGVLPQNPQTLFTCKTVEEDLLEILAEMRLSKAEKRERMRRMAALCRLDGLLSSHPYDLSGGEQQRAALAKVLLLQPKILLLDEPTKGFDAEFKTVFAGILRKLADAGAAVVMVSHDIEFCAEYADTCALFFDGGVVTEGTPREFFSGNSFYTSAANRMVRHRIPHAITANEVIEALGGKAPDHRDGGDAGGDGMLRDPAPETAYVLPSEVAPPPVPKRRSIASLSPARKVAACVSCAGLIATILFAALNFSGLKAFISGGDLAVGVASEPGAVWKYAGILLSLAVCASALVVSFSWRRDAPAEIRLQIPRGERKLPARTLMAAAMILVAVPLTIFVGVYFLGDRKYYFISLLIIVETILPFIFVFEGRKPQAREIVIIAVLCALAGASRVAFFMLPQFKPVVAFVIICGVTFGGESGFLLGAMTAFVSNMFFGQGPWTPWQMLAFGLIGFLSGVLFQKGILLRNKGALAIFGALATFFIYGGVMNASMVLMYQPSPTKEMFFAYYLQGIPFDLVHAAATVFFLQIIARPMLEKLDRIKVKYGLVEARPPALQPREIPPIAVSEANLP